MIGSSGIRRSYLLFDADHNFPTDRFADFMRDVGVPGTDLAEIDNALQARFFQKNPDGSQKERWELDRVQVNCPPEKFRQHLTACGFIDETNPSQKCYDYAAWPGALVTRAVVRLNDLRVAWKKGVRWKELIVFGGKRPLQTDKENFEACCKTVGITQAHTLRVAQENWENIKPQTEFDMMRWVWSLTIQPISFGQVDTFFVDAPMRPPIKDGGPPVRPTTEDTILEWLKGNPKPGSVLLSSGAPYGMAQDEAFWMLLEPHGFTVETFGHAAPDLPVENFMKEVAGCVNRIRRARKA